MHDYTVSPRRLLTVDTAADRRRFAVSVPRTCRSSLPGHFGAFVWSPELEALKRSRREGTLFSGTRTMSTNGTGSDWSVESRHSLWLTANHLWGAARLRLLRLQVSATWRQDKMWIESKTVWIFIYNVKWHCST